MHNSTLWRRAAVVSTLFSLAIVAAPTARASVVADYRFEGTLESSVAGAPALTLVGSGQHFESTILGDEQRIVLVFPDGQGLDLTPTDSIIARDEYSISIVVELDDVGWWHKVFDFQNGEADAGVYVRNYTGTPESGLAFWPLDLGEPQSPIRSNVWHELSITRDAATKQVILYIDGAVNLSFVDSSDYAVIDAAQHLRFVVPDRAFLGADSPGSVARIRIWDEVIVPEPFTPVDALGRCEPPDTCPPVSGTAIPPTERAALMAIYQSLNGDCWTNNEGWGCPVGTECGWHGVSCSDGRVTGIELPDNNVLGPLPPEIGNLTELRAIRVTGRLTGLLPESLGNLAKLERLEIVSDRLDSQPLPAWIGALTNLKVLNMQGFLAGPLPDEIGNLTRLERMDFNNNLLSGSIPDSIGNLRQLQYLALTENALSGSIPDTICNLTNLTFLHLRARGHRGFDRMTGPIPSCIGNLTKLEFFTTIFQDLTGPIPESIGNMKALKVLRLGSGGDLTGPVPSGLWNLTNLEELALVAGSLEGEISPAIGNMTNLAVLTLAENRFSGPLPSAIGSLTKLRDVDLRANQFSGPIPDSIGNATSLERLTLSENDFTGTLPSSIGNLSKLDWLRLEGNRIEGSIPPSVGNLQNLTQLILKANQFSGTVPPELGGMQKLQILDVTSNLLGGVPPAALVDLPDIYRISMVNNRLGGEVPSAWTGTKAAQLEFGFNALTAAPSVAQFLETKGRFADLQTVAPTEVRVEETAAFTARLAWTPISYSWDPGGYQVLVSTNPGGPYTLAITTSDKRASTALVTGLQPQTTYYFVVRTVTFPSGGGTYYQLNTNFSEFTDEVTTTTTVATPTSPNVIVTAVPSALVQVPGQGGATTSFVLTNIGGTATDVTLTQNGTFFTQEPSSFNLGPGETQAIGITGLASPEGDYAGESIPAGQGIPAGLTIPVVLASGTSSGGTIQVRAETNRISLVAPEAQNPTGQMIFRNDGDTAFVGVATADVEFLAPQQGIVTIQPGASVSVSVTSDRARRPDAGALNGTQVGSVALVSLPGLNANGRTTFDGAAAASLVTVVDTVKPDTRAVEIPPLGDGEVALLIPSVGHIVGSVGEFVSDVSILNARGIGAVSDIDLYYTSSGGTSATSADLNAIGTGASVSLADVVKSVFDGDQEVGTLQIRSKAADSLSVSANVFNATDPRGFFGTSIPVFRSDRGAGPGGEIFLTGLRKDDSGHTNLYLQEVEGSDATVRIDFFEAGGTITGSTEASVRRFGLTSIQNPLSPGTVMVRITNTGGGRVVAYATPVDRASGDTWAVADWASLYGFNPRERLVIPVGGAVQGANETDFRTDVAISNRCARVIPLDEDPLSPCLTDTLRARLRYVPASGATVEKQVEIGLLETVVLNDVVRDFLGITTDTIGSIEIDPESGLLAATSRTYTLVGGTAATFGSTVPALGISRTLRPGQTMRIGGLTDTTRATIGQGTPATLRTNFGLVEVAGEELQVRVTVYFSDPRALAAGKPLGSRVFTLPPRGFQNINNMVEAVVGPARETLYGDLSGVMIQFDVVSETGALFVYTSSIDNGTGDSILRTD